MPEQLNPPSSFFKKAVGFDEIERDLSELKSLILARFEELDRQMKHTSDSVAYSNHQLLQVREKLENLELLTKTVEKPVSKKKKEPDFNEVERAIFDLVKKSGKISAPEASLLSGLSRTRTSEVLNSLTRKSAISKEKEGRVSFFILNSGMSEKSSGGEQETE